MILHPVVMDVKLLLEQLGPIVFSFTSWLKRYQSDDRKRTHFTHQGEMQKFAFSLKTFHHCYIKGKALQIGMIFAFVLEFIRTVQKSDICLASNNNFETALYNNTFLYAHCAFYPILTYLDIYMKLY